MGIFRRSSSSSTTPEADRAAAAQNDFVAQAGPAHTWTRTEQATFNRLVSERQNAEADNR